MIYKIFHSDIHEANYNTYNKITKYGYSSIHNVFWILTEVQPNPY